MLLCLQSQARQTGVASVPIHVGRRRRSIGTRRRWNSRIQRGVAKVVQVVEAVETGSWHTSHRGRDHTGCHTHGGDGVWWGKHGLRGEGIDIHGIEEREAFGGQGSGREALSSPIVVRVAGIHVVVRLHESVELRAEAVLAKLSLLIPLPFPPLRSAILEPHLKNKVW